MVAQVTLLSEPIADSLNMTPLEFEEAASRLGPDIQATATTMNLVAQEVNVLASNASAAAASLSAALWVSGTTYTAGVVVYSPIDKFNYRRKITGAGTTDPSNDPTNWALLTVTSNGGADVTSSAVDVTLTSTSARLQIITMTAASKKVTFPAATSLSKGATNFLIKNAGTFRFSMHKNGGAFVGYLQPGQIASISFSDISTSAGVLHVLGQDIERLFDGNTPEVLNAVDSRLIAVANLTSTKAICAYINNATGFLNAVVVNFGSASGTPIVVNGEVSRDISIAAQSATQATVVYKNSAGTTKGYVLDISGNAITPGTVATIDAGTGSNGTGLAALSATQLICAFGSAGGKEKVLDIASSVITPSAIVTADATVTNVTDNALMKKITSTKTMYCFCVSVTNLIGVRLQSITGSTPAPTGTLLQLSAPGTLSNVPFAAVVMSTTRAIVARPLDRSVGEIIIHLIDVSGTSPVLIRSVIVNVGLSASALIELTQLDANNAYMTWLSGLSQGVDSMTITITADDRILTSPVNEKLDSSITATDGYLACAALDSTHVMQMTRNASTFLSAKTIEIAT